MWHDTGASAGIMPPGLGVQPGTPYENPESKRRFRNLVEVSGLIDHLKVLKPRSATEDEIERVHTRAHIENIKAMSAAGGGDASYLSPFGRGSFEIALFSAGGAICALDAVMRGEIKNAYALVRPPGHHAVPDLGMGFCLFGNVGVAIRHAQATYGLKRIATVDWDVHHGNGTQAIFWDDPDVLYVSTHQHPLYPGTGRADEVGGAGAAGLTLNLPLPPGATGDVVRRALDDVARPAIEAFSPDWVLVSCGFDAHRDDPLSNLDLESGDFAELARVVAEFAPRPGRVALFLEGGYDLDALRSSVTATLGALLGRTGDGRARRSDGGPGLVQLREADEVRRRAVDRMLEEAGS
jgi:acetoin utilization deacetylase AcuC-like enzyme